MLPLIYHMNSHNTKIILCQPDNKKGCSACCGLFNLQDISKKKLQNFLHHGSSRSGKFQINPDLYGKYKIKDIRDPKVMEFLVELEKALKVEPKIQGVSSVGLFFGGGVPEDLDEIKEVLNQIPGSEGFFNSGYSMTPIFISVDQGLVD